MVEYKISKIYEILRNLVKDINPNATIKNRISVPEGYPAFLFGTPIIQHPTIDPLSEERMRAISFDTVIMTSGGQGAVTELTNLYEDFEDAIFGELTKLLEINNIYCSVISIGRFQPDNGIFGKLNDDNVLHGDITFNIRMK